MNTLVTFLLLFIFRLVLPFGAILLLGEWLGRRKASSGFAR